MSFFYTQHQSSFAKQNNQQTKDQSKNVRSNLDMQMTHFYQKLFANIRVEIDSSSAVVAEYFK